MNNRVTHERADELKVELEAHLPEQVMLDGLTAADSLARLIKTQKEFARVIVFDGNDYARRIRNESAQHVLFDEVR